MEAEEEAEPPLKPSPDADTHILFVQPTSTGDSHYHSHHAALYMNFIEMLPFMNLVTIQLNEHTCNDAVTYRVGRRWTFFQH